MTRVRLLVNDLRTYGAQRVALTIASHVPDGIEPELVLWDEPAAPSDWNGIPVVSLPRAPGGGLGFVRQVAALVRLQWRDPVPMMAFLTYSNLLATTARRIGRPFPLLVSEHNHTSTAMKRTTRKVRLKLALMRRLYAHATAMVGVSDDVSRDLANLVRVHGESVTTVYNPVDVPAIRDLAKAELSHPWLDDGRDAPVVVCPGALRHAKGQSRLLRALARAPHWRAVFVGDGESHPELVGLARDLGVTERIAWVGFQDNPYPWMSAADVVVVPSRWEGFGLVAVEAAAAGGKVIGSSAVGLSEVLGLIGADKVTQTGPDDEDAFADELARVMDAVAARPTPPYALDRFDPSTVALRYVELLEVS